MNFKLKLALSFVFIYTILISISLFLTFRAFKSFSEEAFFDRLEQKAYITVELLDEFKNDDITINHIIGKNSSVKKDLSKIYVFDSNNKLIYENGNYLGYELSISLINQIRKDKEVEFFIHDDYQVCGIGHTYNNKDFVVIIIAKDTFGEVKLKKLKDYIIFPLLFTILLVFIAAYYYMQQIFQPIDKLNTAIQEVTDANLYRHLEVGSKSKDLNQIAINFNKMLDRLKISFENQKNFNQSASHQLKTPLAIVSSLLRKLENSQGQEKELIKLVQGENDKMAKLVDYLLLLNRLKEKNTIPFSEFRIDELLFEVSEEAEELHEDFSLLMDFQNEDDGEDNFTFYGNRILIKSALLNLINNAAVYSIDRQVIIKLTARNSLLVLEFQNKGYQALNEDVFSPFIRSENSNSVSGNGLGLHIVKSIIEFHKGRVQYNFFRNIHCFTIKLKR